MEDREKKRIRSVEWKMNKYNNDPEYREREKQRVCEYRRERMKDPDFKARVYEQQRQYRLRKKERAKKAMDEAKAKIQYARQILKD